MPKPPTCILCDAAATWIRHTQFAGSHELCDAHARAEADFLVEDSTKDWEYVGGDAVVLAQHLFRLNHARCFWHMPPDFVVTAESVPAIAKGLRTYGGHQGFLLAAALLERHDKTALDDMLAEVTPENLHAETDCGADVGAEVV